MEDVLHVLHARQAGAEGCRKMEGIVSAFFLEDIQCKSGCQVNSCLLVSTRNNGDDYGERTFALKVTYGVISLVHQ